ncbi:MAG: flotillin [Planctomycetota bacterium]|nr:MAG: flotillin [Planctomycetota bacterium]
MDFLSGMTIAVIVFFVVSVIVIGLVIVKCFMKIVQGTALVRTGMGKTKVSFNGIMVYPVVHRHEIMDISLKRIEIVRLGKDGLICKDNLRADIKVAFFVQVSKNEEAVIKVAQSIGCKRASQQEALEELFDAKFSEALKSVGKRFDFIDLYNSREKFRDEILKVIGKELNGYILDDCAIDYLEQTDLEHLSPDNILDAEGIKKITRLTAAQSILSNDIENEKEKKITQQNVNAREAILEMERQLAETEEKQKREVANVKSREEAEIAKVDEEEKLKSERARISTEEELQIAEENKQRQVIVALKNKERTHAVETERVEKDRQLEITERERIVALADIEKDKAIEIEKKLIQDVIKERVMVEKLVVEEEEKIKDTREFAAADREKKVAITDAERMAEQELVKDITAAEAEKKSSVFNAEKTLIDADASEKAAMKKADEMKVLAEALTAEEAAVGLAQAQVIEAKASAMEKQGVMEALVMEEKFKAEAQEGLSEAKVIEAKAIALEKQGLVEAHVMSEKYNAEASGIEHKAEAMKLFDDESQFHEQFKLQLEKDKEVEITELHIQKDIAIEQAEILKEGLRTAKIDIVGGDTMFFDKLINSITTGKSIDRTVDNSKVLTDVKQTFFNGDPAYFKDQLSKFVDQFGMSSEDLKNISLSALIGKLMTKSKDKGTTSSLEGILDFVQNNGLADKAASLLNL